MEEIFEARPPRGKAVLSDVNGKVVEVADAKGEKIIRIEAEPEEVKAAKKPASRRGKKAVSKESEVDGTGIKEFRIPISSGLLVEAGSTVKKGDFLSEGHADLKELLKFVGVEETQHYIVKEVQKIYSLQGAPIHDKHIEVIVRQMFSRVRIKESGDTVFTAGEVTEKMDFRRENIRVMRQAKKPAKAAQLLLGITRIALTTSSFLSAASFQETARVLIDAAVQGKRDPLRGLKENVIIGRLIPAGTGWRKG